MPFSASAVFVSPLPHRQNVSLRQFSSKETKKVSRGEIGRIGRVNTDTDGFLEHWPNGGIVCYKGPALQKVILGFWGEGSSLV